MQGTEDLVVTWFIERDVIYATRTEYTAVELARARINRRTSRHCVWHSISIAKPNGLTDFSFNATKTEVDNGRGYRVFVLYCAYLKQFFR